MFPFMCLLLPSPSPFKKIMRPMELHIQSLFLMLLHNAPHQIRQVLIAEFYLYELTILRPKRLNPEVELEHREGCFKIESKRSS